MLKKVPTVIKFNQKAWLKPYIDMNTDLRKASKMILKKTFSCWSIIQFLEELWKMFKNIGTLHLIQQEKRRNYLISGPNYHTTKFFTENLMTMTT